MGSSCSLDVLSLSLSLDIHHIHMFIDLDVPKNRCWPSFCDPRASKLDGWCTVHASQVHGWRMDLNDAVRLVSPSFVCGEKDPHEVFLGAGEGGNLRNWRLGGGRVSFCPQLQMSLRDGRMPSGWRAVHGTRMGRVSNPPCAEMRPHESH